MMIDSPFFPPYTKCMNLVGFFLELGLLFILSRSLIQTLHNFFFLLIPIRSFAMTAVTVLLFPGTVLHELSHLITAEVLQVRTGKITLIPQEVSDEETHLGSVQIASSDPIRRYIIGLAPLIVGIIALVILSIISPQLIENVSVQMARHELFSHADLLLLILTFYLFFAVSNTMFSSREDVQGILPFLLLIAILLVAAWYVGFKINLTGRALEASNALMQTLVQTLGLVLVINIALLLITRILLAIAEKILGRKIVAKSSS